MPTRKISTKLLLEGEKEYRSAIRGVNGDLRELESYLRLVEAQYSGQKNTLSALESKQKALTDVIARQNEKLKVEKDNLQKCKDLQQKYADAAEKAKAAMKALADSADDAGKETEEYKKEMESLSKEVDKYEDAAAKAGEAAQKHATNVNKAEAKLVSFNSELSKNERYLDEARNSADQCARSIDEYGKETQEAGKQTSAWQDTLKGILASDIVKNGIRTIAEAVKDCISSFIEFESAMAGVRKTTEMSDYEFAQMSKSVQEMAGKIPLTTTEIAALAEAGGQLGVAKENLMDFVEVMAMIGSSTNLSAEEAATAIAQIANIMGTSADEYVRFGSALVDLGNNFATTEKDILELAQRLAGAGSLVGMSEADILALATAMGSVGINAEAGGTAISRLITEIEKAASSKSKEGVEVFAELAGMDSEQFVKAWDVDAYGVLTKIIQGLSEVGENGGSVLQTLADDMGITSARLLDILSRLAGADGLLERSGAVAKNAWAQGNALANEAMQRYETMESKIQLLKNNTNVLLTNLGGSLAPLLQTLVDGANNAITWANEMLTGSQTLQDTIDSIDTTYEGKAENIEGTATSAERLVGILADLEGNTSLTADQQAVWNEVIGRLLETMPSLNELINQQTGEITGGTEALMAHISQWEELALEEAKQEALADKKAAYTAALKEQLKAQVDLTVAMREYEELSERVKSVYDKYGVNNVSVGQVGPIMQKIIAMGELTGVEINRYNELRSSISVMENNLADLSAQTAVAHAEYESWDAELSQSVETYGALTDGVNALGESMQAVTYGTQEMTEYEKEQRETFQAMLDDTNALIEMYKEVSEESRKQVDSVIDGFQVMNVEAEQSMADTLAALDSEILYMNNYAELLKKAAELGVDDGLIAALSDGSEKSYAILQGIVADGEAHIGELNAKFAQVDEGKEAMVQAMTDAKTGVGEELAEITVAYNDMVANFDQYAAAHENARQTMQGTIDALEEALVEIESRMGQIAQVMAGNQLNNIKADKLLGKYTNPYTVKASSHAAGLDYVPADDYPARLHKGEMVLTALEAKAYRAEQFVTWGLASKLERANVTNNDSRFVINITVNGGNNASGRRIAEELRRELRYRGVFGG